MRRRAVLVAVTCAVALGGVGAGACAKHEETKREPEKGAAASLAGSVQSEPSPSASASAIASVAPAPSARPPDATRPDLSRQRTTVVHIGDSFTEAYFEQNLRARVSGVGAKYLVKAQTPSYTTTWAFGGYDGTLEKLLNTRPALVLITLGANEIEMKPPEQHAKAVRELARQTSKWGQCIWITPPLWKKDTGFMEVIRQNCAPCFYWNSDEHVQDVARQRDGIHPNEAGGAKWAAAFWDWLEANRDPDKGPWRIRDGAQ